MSTTFPGQQGEFAGLYYIGEFAILNWDYRKRGTKHNRENITNADSFVSDLFSINHQKTQQCPSLAL